MDNEISVSRRNMRAFPPGWFGHRIRRRRPPRRRGTTRSKASRSKASWCSRILEASAILISLPALGRKRVSAPAFLDSVQRYLSLATENLHGSRFAQNLDVFKAHFK